MKLYWLGEGLWDIWQSRASDSTLTGPDHDRSLLCLRVCACFKETVARPVRMCRLFVSMALAGFVPPL